MQAYHNDPALKQRLVDTAIRERELDHIIRGQYGPDEDAPEGAGFRGCAVGCTIYAATGRLSRLDEHDDYPELIGLPVWLAHLQDWCFETMAEGHQTWPERLLGAIPVGADLGAARHRILARIQREIVVHPTEINERVAKLHDRAASGDMPAEKEWAAASPPPGEPRKPDDAKDLQRSQA